MTRSARCYQLVVSGFLLIAAPALAADGPGGNPAASPSINNAALTYLQRSAALGEDDVPGRMGLAQWCEASGLERQAMDLYHQVLQLKPDHQLAYEALVHLSDTVGLAEENARIEQLRGEFPDAFGIHVSPHFLVVYDTDEQWARQRAALLEKAHAVYFNTFGRLGYRPIPLPQRLVCVLFDSHENFMAYGKAMDNMTMEWSAGYYSTRSNRTAFFHDRQNPAYEHAAKRISELDSNIAQYRQQIRHASTQRNHAAARQIRQQMNLASRERTWYHNRLEAVAKLGNASKTVHEAVHQLAYNSGIQVVGRMYPFWVTEGLATNFETDDPSKPFGPMHDNLNRSRLLIEAHSQDRLMPLADFVALHQLPDSASQAESVAILYSQAWGTFRFLFRYKADQTRDYLRALAEAEPGPREAEQLRAEFIEAYGRIDTIEKLLENYFKRLR